MPVVSLRVVIVVQNGGRFLARTNERKPISNPFGMAGISLNFP
jgi:hypothetical protein